MVIKPNEPQYPVILSQHGKYADIYLTGGKGVNLLRLAREGFPVSPLFIISTAAYDIFMGANRIREKIDTQLAVIKDESDPGSLETVSENIRSLFTGGDMPADLKDMIVKAYRDLGEPAVAVRSSATTEDLPELSFAGQQDTYLNVVSQDALLDAVVRCWGSLWTARAIGYRLRNQISNSDLSLAVVVQKMVPSEVSGVLFTANPVSGLRSETVIEATYGLGEALVSGRVEPDNYAVDTREKKIVNISLGKKALRIQGASGGGTQENTQNAESQQALSDAQIMELAQLGSRVALVYDSPQDIEWALYDGQFYLLQTRAITSLYPLPDGIEPQPLKVMFSLASVQGLFEPMTPLGQDAIKTIFGGGGRLFGYTLDHAGQTAVLSAGERLWINVSSLLGNRLGRRIFNGLIGYIEPGVHYALLALQQEPALKVKKGFMRPARFFHLLRLAHMMQSGLIKSWKHPKERSKALVNEAEETFNRLFREQTKGNDLYSRLERCVSKFDCLYDAFPTAAPIFLPAIASGMSSLFLLNRLSARHSGKESTQGENDTGLGWQLTRGIPNNVTTEMDLALWETAKKIKKDTVSLALFHQTKPQELGRQYLEEALPPASQQALHSFMHEYGMRAVGEFDLGVPRWNEKPAHIFQVLQGYLSIEDTSRAPDAVFKRGAAQAEKYLDRYCNAIRSHPLGKAKASIIRWLAVRVRTFVGFRESPKFYIIRVMGVIREALLGSGREMVEAGLLNAPDDLFYLSINEIKAIAAREMDNWQALINDRRQAYIKEQRRRQIPRVLVSDGRTFYENMHGNLSDEDNVLYGTAVSPGVVEGTVRVVFNPLSARIAPGEILVCPGTDPAWTPLFLTAGGLVMEMGGMMTHGSVVAREYGIPAVVGVNKATIRLKDGQRIRVDGTSGQITIIDLS